MVTAEIKDVKIDEVRGSIIVETEYKVNGVVVQVGNTRYTEESGTNLEIIAKAKEDVALHCENLIRRIEANQTFRNVEALKAQKALTEPIATEIKKDLVGYKTDKTEVIDVYKGVEIKVTADSINSVKTVSDTKEL
jgi:hypothetical protein